MLVFRSFDPEHASHASFFRPLFRCAVMTKQSNPAPAVVVQR